MILQHWYEHTSGRTAILPKERQEEIGMKLSKWHARRKAAGRSNEDCWHEEIEETEGEGGRQSGLSESGQQNDLDSSGEMTWGWDNWLIENAVIDHMSVFSDAEDDLFVGTENERSDGEGVETEAETETETEMGRACSPEADDQRVEDESYENLVARVV